MSLLPDDLYVQDPQNAKTQISEVGALLKKTREAYNLSLQDVSEYLNIRKGLLEALEAGNRTELPGDVYAIGFVKSYAQYLNLNVEDLVQSYKREIGMTKKKVSLDLPVTPKASQSPEPKILLSALAGFIVIVSLLFWFFSDDDKQEEILQTPNVEEVMDIDTSSLSSISELEKKLEVKAVEEAPELPEKQIIQEAETQTSDLVLTNKTTIYGAENVHARVALKAVSNSWVEITNAKGKKLLSRILEPDDVFYVPVEGGAFLTTGNAGGLEVYVDKTYAGLAGKPAEVLKNYKITPTGLVKE